MNPKTLTRRQALARLGLGPALAYTVPTVLALSTAAEAASKASKPTVPTPPTPPSEPSSDQNVDREVDESLSDQCRNEKTDTSGPATISQRDSERAQDSVDAGYAKPLRQIWPGIQKNYKGRIVSVQFTGFRYRPTYRLRAISPSGRLETVIVSARTGDIIRIVGC